MGAVIRLNLLSGALACSGSFTSPGRGAKLGYGNRVTLQVRVEVGEDATPWRRGACSGMFLRGQHVIGILQGRWQRR